MPTTLTNGIQLPDKGSVDWYSSMQSNYNLIDTHLGNTDVHVTAEDKANWNSKQGSLSQAQLDAIAQVSTNTSDIASLQSGKADASHTHSSSDIIDIGDYATKQYVDNSISGLVDNAPAALDTLKELSTALNDDANFASTVTTALGAKANSADLATVAISGSYTDLTDKPTIPTNTSDLTNDSDFVVSSNLATIATSGDYDDLSNKPSIPTNTSDLNNDSGFVTLNDFDIPAKTSDLTNDSGFITSSDVPTSTSDLINDSNFVDTSNSAVASGITSAKVTDYDTHIADTDIHVTTADKTKWNNGVSQAYVLRYSSSSVTDNSTIAYSTLDNTDNIKLGDKVIDVDGKIFSVVSVDTANQTVTVGSALIDLALDANVVHTSGNETVGGQKTFTNDIILQNSDTSGVARNYLSKSQVAVLGDVGSSDNTKYRFVDKNNNEICYIRQRKLTNSNTDMSFCVNNIDNDNNSISAEINFIIDRNNDPRISPSVTDFISLGRPTFRWKSIYSNSYYYGNVEFSTKFVTTDTAQTVSGAKAFSDNLTIYNSDDTQTPKGLNIRNAQWGMGESGGTTTSSIKFLDKNSTVPASIIASKGLYGQSFLRFSVRTKDSQNNALTEEIYYDIDTSGNIEFRPWHNNTVNLGTSIYRWKDCQTYLINGLTPSSLSLPDLSNGIDISSYMDVSRSSTNYYTPPANGWISISINTPVRDSIQIECGGGFRSSVLSCMDPENSNNYIASIIVPCIKNDTATIYFKSSQGGTIKYAYFYPCQGNV